MTRLGWTIFAVWAVTIFVGGVANAILIQNGFDYERSIVKFATRLDLGHEPSFPNFLSAVWMFLCSGMLFLISMSHDPKLRNRWRLIGIVFLMMSLDEAIILHETLDSILPKLINVPSWLYMPWVMAGAAFAALFGIWSIKLLMAIEPKTRNLFLLSGGLFVFGSVGVEFVTSLVFAQIGGYEEGIRSVWHLVLQCFEEGAELGGIGLFLWALIRFYLLNCQKIQFVADDDK